MAKRRSPAHRRYLIRLSLATAAYLISLALAVRLLDSSVIGPAAYLLALLPGLSVAAIFWAVGRLLVEEKDEYRRVLLVRQSLIASGFTLSVATIWGFFENFGLVEHVDAFYIAVLWFFGLAVGSVYNFFTLRAPEDRS